MLTYSAETTAILVSISNEIEMFICNEVCQALDILRLRANVWNDQNSNRLQQLRKSIANDSFFFFKMPRVEYELII